MLKFIASSVRGGVLVEVYTLIRSERVGYIISCVVSLAGSEVGPFVVGVAVFGRRVGRPINFSVGCLFSGVMGNVGGVTHM